MSRACRAHLAHNSRATVISAILQDQMGETIRRSTCGVNGDSLASTDSPVVDYAYEGFGQKDLLTDCLLRFIQMFLEIRHEGCAARSHSSGVACVGLMLTVNVAVGVANVDLAEFGQEIDA